MSDSPQLSRAGQKRRSGDGASNASPVPSKRSETSSSASIPSNSASPNVAWLDDDDVCIMLTPSEVAVRVREAVEHAKLICDSEYAARIAELEAKHAAEKIEMSIKFDRLRTKTDADHRRELDAVQQKLSSYKTALELTSKVKKELLDETHADTSQGNWAAREDALRTELESRHRFDLAQKDAEIVGLQADLQAKGQRIAELTQEKAGLVKEKTRLASNFEKARQDARVCRQQVTVMEQKLAAQQSATSPTPPAPSAGISSRVHSENQIHVSHLSPETTEATLAQFFSSFGTVVATVVVRDSATKQSRGFGFVQFSSPAEVALSVTSFNYVIDGRIVHVNRRKR